MSEKKGIPRVTSLGIFVPDKADAIRETAELSNWLGARTTFKERSEVAPLLEQSKSFCASIGATFGESVLTPDHLSFELSLGGNYFPDLVIGDSVNRSLVLVEFEGAEKNQIYLRQKKDQQYPDFSPKFRQGFFQLLDWVHRLKDASDSNKLDWFTFIPDSIRTVLVIGRDYEVGANDQSQGQRRLRSLAQSITPGHNRLFIVTYDQLVLQVEARLRAF